MQHILIRHPLVAVILCAFIAASTPAAAEIYKWTDASGQVHFGDNVPGKVHSEKVSVRVNTYKNVTYEVAGRSGPASMQVAGGKSVVLYGTQWCGYCKKARAYFTARKIRYTDYDIENDSAARAQFDAFGGRGVPVIFVGNMRMNGFNESGFEGLYKRP